MNFGLLPDILTAAVVLSGIYVLIALAWVIVFYAAHLVNFATGEMLVIGGFGVATAMTEGFSYSVAVLSSLVVVALIGAGIYVGLLRPLAGHTLLTPVIVTFGAAVVLQGLILLVWGSSPRFIDAPGSDLAFSLPGGITLTALGLVIPVVALIVYFGALLVTNGTSVGLRMRAAHESALLASQRGIHIYTIFAIAFTLATVLAALAGILHTQRSVVSWSIIPMGIKGLVPALIGGLDSIKGVLPGALIVGFAESLAVLNFGARFSDVTVFTLLLLVLLVRPSGLFGTIHAQRV